MAENDLSRGVAKFIQNISRALDGEIKDGVSKAAAQAAADLIRTRTRQGYGNATDGGAVFRLRPLSANYIDFRRAHSSRLSSDTSPTKSNLTFTGQMLDSLSIKRSSPGNWLVILKGTHSTGISNAQLARYVSRARPFMSLSGSEVAKVQAVARRTFESLVKKTIR